MNGNSYQRGKLKGEKRAECKGCEELVFLYPVGGAHPSVRNKGQ
jgi:hypothetical protein